MCRKIVEVIYDWKPPMCKHCCVFGHEDVKCGKKEVNVSVEKENVDQDKGKAPELAEELQGSEGFKEVTYKKNKNNVADGARKHNVQNVQAGKFHKPTARFEFQPKAKIQSGNMNNDKLKIAVTNEQRKVRG